MKIKKLLLNALPLLLVGWVMAYAAAPMWWYLPNATLDPDCVPWDIDCFVQVAPELTSVWDNTDGTTADEASMDINYMNGNVAIGLNAPISKLHVQDSNTGGLIPFMTDGWDGRASWWVHNNYRSSTFGPTLSFRKHRGTKLSPLALTNNNSLMLIIAQGYGDTTLGAWGSIEFDTSENWSDSSRGTRLTFSTTQNGTNSPTEQMRINGEGNVGIGTITPTNDLQIGNVWSHTGYALATISDIYGALIQTKNSISSAAALWVRWSTEWATPTSLFRVQNNGRVAMGTDTPEWGMHMLKDNADARILIERTDGVAGWGFLWKAWGTDVGTWTTLAYMDAYGEVLWADSWMGRIALHSGDANMQQGEIVLSTSNDGYPTEKMRITKDGKVGIWTTEPTKELEVAGKVLHDMTLANAARGICYSALPAGPSNKSIIMVPLPSNTADLDDVCHTTINPSWHAAWVAKGNYFNQNCPDIENDNYGWGYTSFVEESYFEANAALFPSCDTTNTVVCCSTAFTN